MLARDTKRIEDVDTISPDHGADAIRSGCQRQEWATKLKITGTTIREDGKPDSAEGFPLMQQAD